MSLIDPPLPLEPPTFFRCDLQQTGYRAARLQLSGELDLSSGWYLAVRLADVFAEAHLVLVDLRELTFIDRSGLAVIVAADARARARGRRLMIIRGALQVERLMQVSGLIDGLDVAPRDVFRGAPELAVLAGRS